MAGTKQLILSKYVGPTETLSMMPTLATQLQGRSLKGSVRPHALRQGPPRSQHSTCAAPCRPHLSLFPRPRRGTQIMYYDGQFDDARLAVTLACSAAAAGAAALNYTRAKSLIKVRALALARVVGVRVGAARCGGGAALHGDVVRLPLAVVCGAQNHEGKVVGVRCEDVLTGQSTDVYARVVVNATGPFLDGVRRMSDPQ